MGREIEYHQGFKRTLKNHKIGPKLFHKIDSRNLLTSVDTLLPYLISCQRLCLDENLIADIDATAADCLQEISVRKTPLAQNPARLRELSDKFPSIRFVAQ
jgi:hypothetical protein